MNAIRKLETWALQVLDRVASGSPIEDSRVELKATLIEPTKAARRIAGHANAARGESILWLIGVDERTGIEGIGQVDHASWLNTVNAQFQGTTPALLEIAVPYQNRTVIALQFDTQSAPYLVRNPLFGKQGGGGIELEVPWREGSKVRTARREDLLHILIPKSLSPEVEVLSASLYVAENINPPEPSVELWFVAMLYLAPRSSERLVFPIHRALVEAYILPEIQGDKIPLWRLAPSDRSGLDAKRHSEIRAGSNELIVDGAGMVNLRGSTKRDSMPREFGDQARAVVVLPAAGDQTEIRFDLLLTRNHETLPSYALGKGIVLA